MKERSLLLRLLGDAPLFRIIDFLIENKGMDFTKSDIAEGADISRASLFKYWCELEEHSIVKETRRFGKTKLYTLHTANPIVKRLLDLEKTLIHRALKEERKEVFVRA